MVAAVVLSAFARGRVHYYRLGEGPLLVLLHGMGSCAMDWFPVAPALAGQFTLLLVDLRGHGQSSLPARHDFHIASMAADVRGVLDAENASAAHVLGLSLGGCVALQLACDAPERVRRLALAACLPTCNTRAIGEGG